MDMLQKIDEIYENSEYAELETLVSLTEEYFKETKMESYGYFLEEEMPGLGDVKKSEETLTMQSLHDKAAERLGKKGDNSEKKSNIFQRAGKFIGEKLKNLWKMIMKLFEKIKQFFTGKKDDAQKAEELGREVDQLYSTMPADKLLALQRHLQSEKGSSSEPTTPSPAPNPTTESFNIDSLDCYFMEEAGPLKRTISESDYHKIVIQSIVDNHKGLKSFVPMVVHFNDQLFEKHMSKLSSLINSSAQIMKETGTARTVAIDSLRSQMKSYRTKISWEVASIGQVVNSSITTKKVIRAGNYGKYYQSVQQLIKKLNVDIINFEQQAKEANKSFDKIVNEINAYDKSRKYGDGFVNPELKKKVDQIQELTQWLLQEVKDLSIFAGDIRRNLSEEIKSLDKLKMYAHSTIMPEGGKKSSTSSSPSKSDKKDDKKDDKKEESSTESGHPKVKSLKSKACSVDKNDPNYKSDDPDDLAACDDSFNAIYEFTDGILRLGPISSTGTKPVQEETDRFFGKIKEYYNVEKYVAVKKVRECEGIPGLCDKIYITEHDPEHDLDRDVDIYP